MNTRMRRAWFVLAGCFLVSTGFNAYLFGTASIVPFVVEAFGIDKAAAGLAISVVFFGWVTLQIPGGLLMDRYDNRRLVWGGAGVFAVAALAGVVAPTYPTFLGARFVGGTAAVVLWTANANIVSDAFPPARRALGTSLFVTSAPAGVALAQAAGPRLTELVGWRAAVAAYALVTAVGLVPFGLALRGPVRNETQLSLAGFAAALGDRQVLAVAASSFCAYALFVFFNSWMPTYATEEVGVSLGTAGTLAALLPAVGLIARPGGGWLSDRVGGRRPVIIAAFLLVVPALAGAALATSTAGLAAALLLAGLGSQLGTGVFYVYVEEVSPPESGGTSLAVLMTLSIAGSLAAPVAAGWLIGTISWTAAFWLGGVLAAGGIIAVLQAPEPALPGESG
ncbi:nitrate/nitrite transporter [Halosegnis sp.]|uniref:MFS transporter n=1 Tax=Halosegnis sp. TaxID=2864959 RepID=UPI0035D432DC